jgi:hypothetical protein
MKGREDDASQALLGRNSKGTLSLRPSGAATLPVLFRVVLKVIRMESCTSPVMNGLAIRASSERSASVDFSSVQPDNAASTLEVPGFKRPKRLLANRNVPSRCSPGFSRTASMLMRSLTVCELMLGEQSPP